ncbi:hypothetical protein Tco_1463672 [Tanacetum coccineum]
MQLQHVAGMEMLLLTQTLVGVVWHHACSHAVFAVALSITMAPCLSQTVAVFFDGLLLDSLGSYVGLRFFRSMAGFIIQRVLAGHHLIMFAAMLDLSEAAWHNACSHAVLDAALSILAAAFGSDLGVAARHRVCGHVVLREVDGVGNTQRH